MDENTSKLLVFLLIFIFLYGVFAAGFIHVLEGGGEPDPGTGPTPPEPSDPPACEWWDLICQAENLVSTLAYVGTIAGYLLGLGTGFTTYGVPTPLSWILAAIFWILVAAIVMLLVRG